MVKLKKYYEFKEKLFFDMRTELAKLSLGGVSNREKFMFESQFLKFSVYCQMKGYLSCLFDSDEIILDFVEQELNNISLELGVKTK